MGTTVNEWRWGTNPWCAGSILDPVALTMQHPITGRRVLAIPAGWNARLDAALMQGSAEPIAVVAAAGSHRARAAGWARPGNHPIVSEGAFPLRHSPSRYFSWSHGPGRGALLTKSPMDKLFAMGAEGGMSFRVLAGGGTKRGSETLWPEAMGAWPLERLPYRGADQLPGMVPSTCGTLRFSETPDAPGRSTARGNAAPNVRRWIEQDGETGQRGRNCGKLREGDRIPAQGRPHVPLPPR